jgi:hypothetical protein
MMITTPLVNSGMEYHGNSFIIGYHGYYKVVGSTLGCPFSSVGNNGLTSLFFDSIRSFSLRPQGVISFTLDESSRLS